MSYAFYGWETADVLSISKDFPSLRTPRDLYDMLRTVWCRETCAPRMQKQWTPDNPTLGQCSVTAFLVQDLFGGTVYGIPLPDGGFHCYNVVGSCVFDLTSEQFTGQTLVYEGNPEQSRDVHFSKEEKYQRYLLLRDRLYQSFSDRTCGES